MSESITIYPDFEKLKWISPFWDNTHESIAVAESDCEFILNLIEKTEFIDKPDNICYILELLKQENQRLRNRNLLKSNKEKLNKDIINLSKLLDFCNSNNLAAVSKIKLDYGIEIFNQTKEEFEIRPKGSCNLEHPEVIADILQIIWKNHKSSPLRSKDLEKKYKVLHDLNKPQTRRLELVQNLLKYFENIEIGKNKIYYVIGCLFNKSDLEPELSEDYYNDKIKNSSTYKTYYDFVSSRIKQNYIKRGKKNF